MEMLRSLEWTMIRNICVWKHWKEQLPGEGLWEWHVLMALKLVTKMPAHLYASSQGIQHQDNTGQTERRDILKQRQFTSRLKQRLSAFRYNGGKTVNRVGAIRDRYKQTKSSVQILMIHSGGTEQR